MDGNSYFEQANPFSGHESAATPNNEEDRGLVSPDLRENAIVLFGGKQVAAMSVEHRGRDPQYAEQRAKFDALQPVDLTGKEMGDIPLFKRMKEMKEFVFKWIEKQVGFYSNNLQNTDKGWGNIILAPGGIENSLQHGAYPEKISVIPALPQLIQNGIYLEPLPQRNKQHGMIEHVFAAKVKFDTEDKVVWFVIREDNATGRRFYDHEITEIENLDIPPRGLTGTLKPGSLDKGPRQGSVMNIVRKHLGVNPNFTLNAGTRNRGYVEFGPDQYRIVLGKEANLSTLIHETGHVFEEELRRIVASGRADGTGKTARLPGSDGTAQQRPWRPCEGVGEGKDFFCFHHVLQLPRCRVRRISSNSTLNVEEPNFCYFCDLIDIELCSQLK
jgi:hypothetical protein